LSKIRSCQKLSKWLDIEKCI